MAINIEKYKNAILYFIEHCNNKYLGRTKLNKLIYYLDFVNYKERDISVTGDIYINKQYGPVPEKINCVIDELKKVGSIDIMNYKGASRTKIEYKYIGGLQIDIFELEEQDLLKKICKTFKSYSTDDMVAKTHLEAPWFYSKDDEEIDYKRAYAIEDPFNEIVDTF